jgi:hypothetical protein
MYLRYYLLNFSYKIYAKITSNRVHKIAESILKAEQNGFRKSRSYIDCVFTITQLIEKMNEFNLPTYTASAGQGSSEL